MENDDRATKALIMIEKTNQERAERKIQIGSYPENDGVFSVRIA